MKKKYYLNANIIDPYNLVEEVGGVIVNEEGKIEGIGKKSILTTYLHAKSILILMENIYFQV